MIPSLAGVAIGGFGGSISVEVVTASSTCLGDNASPRLPGAPTGSIEGWVSEYVDGLLWLCGGSDLNYRAECFSLDVAKGYWEKVSS